MYLLFGVLTTAVGWIVYFAVLWALKGVMGIPVDDTTSAKYFGAYTAAQVIQWVAAVLFAFFTNRKWVFESRAETIPAILRECASFVSCRLGTGVLDQIIMVVGVDVVGQAIIPADLADIWSMGLKIASNVLVIVLNYVLSKLIIFRKQKG